MFLERVLREGVVHQSTYFYENLEQAENIHPFFLNNWLTCINRMWWPLYVFLFTAKKFTAKFKAHLQRLPASWCA